MLPSLADSANRMDTSGSSSRGATTTTPRSTTRIPHGTGLYPDLSQSARKHEEDGDVLVAIGVPPAKPKNRPTRPPPPQRSNTVPSAFDYSSVTKNANVSEVGTCS